MNEWHAFNTATTIVAEHNEFIVKCKYAACTVKCIAYLGDNEFFYSMETHKLLPVVEWAFMPTELT